MMLIANILMAARTQGLLAQFDPDISDWVVIIFVVVASLIGSLANLFKKKSKGDEDEDEIILEIPDDEAEDLFRPRRPARPSARPRPPVARRPRPPVIATPAGESRPKRARRFVPPQPKRTPRPPLEPTLTERYAQSKPAPPVQPPPQPRQPGGQRPAAPRRPTARGIARGQTPAEHSRHIAEHADQLARHAQQATSRVTQRHIRPATATPEAAEPAPTAGFAGLENVDSLRRAIVLAEILGPPIALRQETDRF